MISGGRWLAFQWPEGGPNAETPTQLLRAKSAFPLKLRGQDLNLRPSGYEPDELPGCSTPRCAAVPTAEAHLGQAPFTTDAQDRHL
jgi:hypothetical protein